MPAPAQPRLDAYLRHRRGWETAFWAGFWLLQATANSVDVAMDIARGSGRYALWEAAAWEFSSCLTLLALMPAVLAFDRRFPLQRETWRRNWRWHAAFSLVFSAVHVLGMVALRTLVYRAAGADYDFGNWPRQMFYEYLKDARTYCYILAILYFYRLLLLRLRGEVSLLGAPDEGEPVEHLERPERFLVRKLGKEFLIAANDIERLEAAENYVNLHVRGHVYPLRSTMTAIERNLDPARFRRVHRGHIINLDQLAAIEPLETGDARLLLKNGTRIPCSRRYRVSLRESVRPEAAAAPRP
jgi:hypothetical protein